jgi:sensor histidine kinase regulating citrate/malate metabolism
LAMETTPSRKSFLACEVSDTGDGIDEDNRSRIFELGFSTKEGHSGFGLPTMFFLLDSIGGSVRCDSTKGSGTQFFIRFPIINSKEPA